MYVTQSSNAKVLERTSYSITTICVCKKLNKVKTKSAVHCNLDPTNQMQTDRQTQTDRQRGRQTDDGKTQTDTNQTQWVILPFA